MGVKRSEDDRGLRKKWVTRRARMGVFSFAGDAILLVSPCARVERCSQKKLIAWYQGCTCTRLYRVYTDRICCQGEWRETRAQSGRRELGQCLREEEKFGLASHPPERWATTCTARPLGVDPPRTTPDQRRGRAWGEDETTTNSLSLYGSATVSPYLVVSCQAGWHRPCGVLPSWLA